MAQYGAIAWLDPDTGNVMYGSRGGVLHLWMNRILIMGDTSVGILTHRDAVAFASWITQGMVAKWEDTRVPAVMRGLNLLETWLEGSVSVTSGELQKMYADEIAAVRSGVDELWEVHRDHPGFWFDDQCYAWRMRDTLTCIGRSMRTIVAHDSQLSVEQSTGVLSHAGHTISRRYRYSYRHQAQWLVEHLRSAQ